MAVAQAKTNVSIRVDGGLALEAGLSRKLEYDSEGYSRANRSVSAASILHHFHPLTSLSCETTGPEKRQCLDG